MATTPFDCEVTFTGLCALVPRTDANGQISQADWILVNGRRGENRAAERVFTLISRRQLDIHRAFLSFRCIDLPNPPDVPDDAQGIWYLHRQRITFDFVEAPLSTGSPAPDNSLRGIPTLGSHVPEMEKVIGTHGHIDPAALQPVPPLTVASQVILSRGEFLVPSPVTLAANMTFAPRFPNVNTYSLIVTPRIVVRFQRLTSFTVVSQLMDVQQPPRRLSLMPADGGPLRLKIANFCPENPLEWPPKNDDPTPDVDFRWYYELLPAPTRTVLVDSLTTGGLTDVPIPIPTPGSDGRGGDDNCIPSKFIAESI
ncbi:MAG TPA: hypothetical protein VGG06_22145 [Thermoanaerobaculia bacterium]|jgi:hypothetical protein